MAWQNLLPATLYIHWNNLEQWKSSDYLPTGLFVFILRNSSAGFGPEGISYIMHMCGVCMRGSSFCFVFFVGQNLFIAIWSDLIFLTTKKWNVNNIAYTKQTLRYCPAATFASIYEPWIYGFFSLLLCHASGRSVIKWRHAFRYNYQMPADISIFSFDQWLNITNNHMTSANGTRSEHTPHQIFQLCHFLFLLFRRCCASYQRISYVFIYSFGVFCFFFRSSSMFVFILLLTMVVNCYDAKQDLFQHISPFRVCSFFMFGHCVALGHLLYEFLP